MTTITIRNVPGDVHSVLADRAAQHGVSLQTYVLRELIELAEKPDLESWVERVNESSARHGVCVDPAFVVESVRQIRIDAGH